jgi:hypothetical protein
VNDKAEDWRWVGEDGVEKPVAEQELIAELSSESLPNYTLVWKKGWLEWLPAMQVAELAWALPSGKADDPVKPRERQEAMVPPAPPLYRYPVLKRRAANLRSDRPAPLRVRPVAAPPRPPAARLEPPTGATPIEPETLIDPLPMAAEIAPLSAPSLESLSEPSHPSVEEVELDAIKASDPRASLGRIADVSDAVAEDDEDEAEEVEPEDSAPDAAPLGGFAPTPGGVAARAYGEDDEVETRVIRSKPPPPGPMYVGPHVPPPAEKSQSQAPPPMQSTIEEPEFPQIPPARPPPSDLSAFAEARAREPDEQKKRPVAIYALGAVTVALAITVVVLLTRGPSSSTSEASSDPSAESASSSAVGSAPSARAESVRPAQPPPPRKIGKTCNVVTPATRVADWADPSITPIFTPVPGSGRVAVGLGQSDVYAVGITIDPRTLDRDQVFREYKKRHKIASVVPTTVGNHLKFEVTRSGRDMSNARAVDALHLFTIGTVSGGIARSVDDGDPEVVWPLSSADDVTVPRVASIPGIGFAVTFRHGGKNGRVAVGWLDTKGRKKSDLTDVRTDADFAGTPSIATSSDTMLVTFAARGSQDAAWKVVLASAPRGETPKKATPFTLPQGGPGGDAMSPSVAPLSAGKWLLQWTEGSTGNRVIRTAVLGKDLELASDPINLSPDGANAGQGVSFSTGDLATILYYVRNDKKSNELWGASIDCAI